MRNPVTALPRDVVPTDSSVPRRHSLSLRRLPFVPRIGPSYKHGAAKGSKALAGSSRSEVLSGSPQKQPTRASDPSDQIGPRFLIMAPWNRM
jgi:hypothetical protein